jgi:hypothetical protein
MVFSLISDGWNKAGFSANSSPGSFLLTVGLAVRERSRTEPSVISGGV